MSDKTPTIPPPGSDAALERGCTCPVLANGHGAGSRCNGGRMWWIMQDCPLHSPFARGKQTAEKQTFGLTEENQP